MAARLSSCALCVLLALAPSWGQPTPAQPPAPAEPDELLQQPAAAGEARPPRVFYVRQTVGDDAADGLSPERAWRSLSMLESAMQAGDTAYVGPGLYREMITVASGGTAEKRITFIADTTGSHTGDPPGAVTITGADPVDETIFAPGSSPGVFQTASADGRVWGVVEMDGPQYRYQPASDTTEHLRDGISELEVVTGRSSSFFYDLEAKILFLRTSDDRPPASHEIELIRRSYGIVAYGKDYVSVIGFTFRHMGTAGVNFGRDADHGIALGNISYGSWQGIRVSDSNHALIAGNTAFRNGNSGIYFLGGSSHGYAVGNVLYENAKGVRWGSGSANGLGSDNTAFANRENGIAIEDSDDIRLVGNRLFDNRVSQLMVRKSRYVSDANCLESGGAKQSIAELFHDRHYRTLAEYQRAVRQDLASRAACGPRPEPIDVEELHAATLTYAERARRALAERRPMESAQER